MEDVAQSYPTNRPQLDEAMLRANLIDKDVVRKRKLVEREKTLALTAKGEQEKKERKKRKQNLKNRSNLHLEGTGMTFNQKMIDLLVSLVPTI